MSDKNHVRNRAIKMAFENPHLREKMLPLIKKLSGDKAKTEEGAKKLFEKYMDGLTPEGRKNTKKKPQDFYEKPSDSKSESKSKPSGGSSAKPQHKGERDKALMDFFDGTDLSPNEKRVIIDEVNSHIEEARSNVKWRAIETDTGHTPHGLIKELKGNIVETIDERMDGIDFDFEKLTPLAEKLFESAKKEPYNDPRAKSEKKPRENGELPIGDKGQQKRKQMSKADKLKAYQEAIKNSKSMSPEDKKKALEKSKKPGFDADAALGAMGEDEEEDGGKKASLRTQVIRLAHDNPELRSDLLPLLQQAKTANSMPPANGRSAGEKSRRKWVDWLQTDIQTKLEEAGVPQSAIDDAVNRVCDYNYGLLTDKDNRTKKFYYFVTNADIHAWVTGRAKLSDVSPNYRGNFQNFTESYPMMLKWYIAKYGSANNDVLRDKCKALFNKCKDYQCALAASNANLGREETVRFLVKYPSDAKKELATAIEESSVDILKVIAESLEWAAKIPKPPHL